MRAGTLDRKITIQRRLRSFDGEGQEVQTWQAISHRCWANSRPVQGDERFAAQQTLARQIVEFEIRWSQNRAGIGPLDRVLYPAPDSGNEQEPTAGTVHDIIEVAEIGRRNRLKIVAARRTEKTE